jgi:hypothetical protein
MAEKTDVFGIADAHEVDGGCLNLGVIGDNRVEVDQFAIDYARRDRRRQIGEFSPACSQDRRAIKLWVSTTLPQSCNSTILVGVRYY